MYVVSLTSRVHVYTRAPGAYSRICVCLGVHVFECIVSVWTGKFHKFVEFTHSSFPCVCLTGNWMRYRWIKLWYFEPLKDLRARVLSTLVCCPERNVVVHEYTRTPLAKLVWSIRISERSIHTPAVWAEQLCYKIIYYLFRTCWG